METSELMERLSDDKITELAFHLQDWFDLRARPDYFDDRRALPKFKQLLKEAVQQIIKEESNGEKSSFSNEF